ncbi:MAG: 2-C-methyl-D-erythritol 4-phosphate cytidylyltransferase [Candidatus Omnitrophica bacterium]|nr:2-C-methyl-D-erythritol 4-phosphate cytidylyltransferase [Candidatus Omnitrophota bacterium]
MARSRPSLTVIIPAAGSGSRLGFRTPKPYVRLCGKPLLYYALAVFQVSAVVKQIIIAAEPQQVRRAAALVERFGFSKVRRVVAGGRTRTESVRHAFAYAGDSEYVAVHDAARPFVTEAIIRRGMAAARQCGAAICAIPCASTIKAVDARQCVAQTLDRRRLWQIQTPQIFLTELLSRAYAALDQRQQDFFDDAAVVERLPHPVRVFAGTVTNIKITVPEDLAIARAFVAAGFAGHRERC